MSLFAVLGLPIYCTLAYFVLYQYVVPREGCRKHLLLCLFVSVCLQVLIRFCLLTDIDWIAEYNIGKLLTILMVILLLFWGGSLIQGGWVRIGIYLIVTEIIFSISARTYWQVWGMITHASAQEIQTHARVVLLDRATGIQLLVDSIICILLLIPASKLRKIPIKPSRPAQIAVIAYLAYGCLPTTNRVGFDEGNIIPMFVCSCGFAIFMFCLFLSIRNTAERDNRHMLMLKHQALSEQAKIIYLQKSRVRRFRHDIRKHLDATAYLLQDMPDLQDDAVFLQYQNELKAYENVFRRISYCDSEELNISLSQIDQYCLERNIPVRIHLKRLRLSGWKKDDQMVLGMLLYQIFLSVVEKPVSKILISGDCLQGQNVIRLEADYVQNKEEPVGLAVPEESTKPGGMTDDRESVWETAVEDICLVLSQYGGSCTTQQSDQGFVCLLHWDDGEGICLSTQCC